jgi:hypothetical protein
VAKVQITTRISGTRDGVEWPAPGGELTVPDGEAADLVRLGFAKILAKPVERAVPPKAETRKQD